MLESHSILQYLELFEAEKERENVDLYCDFMRIIRQKFNSIQIFLLL